jgi:hypothetical protein
MQVTHLHTRIALIVHGLQDASNDAHSGFTIYSRLIQMAKTMDPVPETYFYSYNVFRGIFCTNSGNLWKPINPYYDPGPPPPPRDPSLKKGATGKDRAEVGSASFAASSLENGGMRAVLSSTLSSSSDGPAISRPGPHRRHYSSYSFGNAGAVQRERNRVRFEPTSRSIRTTAGLPYLDRNYSECVRVLRIFSRGKI